MQIATRSWIVAAAALTLAACGQGGSSALSASSAAAKAAPKTTISTPIITAGGATQTSIEISVCAGASGLPAGFSLQWMTAAALTANGGVWLPSEDPALCKASFSGNANLSRYELAAGECVTVSLGEFLFDNGASTSCSGALTCGTEYVFRAFGHATSTQTRSAFTANLSASTLACGHDESGCTLTQGYWKTHGPIPTGSNENVWPALDLVLGTHTYADQLEWQSIFDQAAAGNGLVALAHQLMAAKLNVASGADASAVATAIPDADALIGALVVPPVGGGFLAPSATSALTGTLASYNEGAIGPGHCD